VRARVAAQQREQAALELASLADALLLLWGGAESKCACGAERWVQLASAARGSAALRSSSSGGGSQAGGLQPQQQVEQTDAVSALLSEPFDMPVKEHFDWHERLRMHAERMQGSKLCLHRWLALHGFFTPFAALPCGRWCCCLWRRWTLSSFCAW
jgi:hypothetical protein